MKLRVGVIGTGFGSQVQIPAFQAHPRVEVVAVASGTPGKAKAVAERFAIPLACDDYRDLLRADLDLVSITAPPHLHHPMALDALAAGRHVLCEKPMALDAAQAQEMTAQAARRRAVALIDHELRFNPNRVKIRRLIAEGFIGRPRHALLTVVGPGRADPTRPWTWWSDARSGGGILGALGSHQIDLLRFWLGEITAAAGTTQTYIAQRPDPAGGGLRPVTADDFTTFFARCASGAVGTVIISGVAAHPGGPRVEIWGDEGTLVLDRHERLWGGRRGSELEELTEAEPLQPPPGMEYAPLWGLSFVRFVDHLVRVALDGAPPAPAATFADGLQVQRVMDAVRETAQRGWVPVAPPEA